MDDMVIRVPFEDGYIGCQCPSSDCNGYFKEQLGTGIEGNPECHCPYCGYVAASDEFVADDTHDYLGSFVGRHLHSVLLDEFKKSEFDVRSSGPFGISVSLKVDSTLPPIPRFRARDLETVVVCVNCSLRYAVYGVFAYCPDCGMHNSLQILDTNLELAEKMAALAQNFDPELSTKLIEDALENEVSAFDSFGRETVRVHCTKATHPDRVQNVSFQNLPGAQTNVQQYFGINIGEGLAAGDWDFAVRCFQKRNLLAHKEGVVDNDYVRRVHDPQAIVGRKVGISSDEVYRLAAVLKDLGRYLIEQLSLGARLKSNGTDT